MPTLTIQQTLELALQHHQAGDLARAEHMYRRVLEHAPRHPDALHLMGVLASQNEQHDAAIGFIEQAISINPDVADFHNNLGEALRRSNRADRAIDCYKRAIALRPDYVDAHSNLAAAHLKAGAPESAIGAARDAIRLDPDAIEAHYNLGLALTALGRAEEAIKPLARVLELAPDFAEAHEAMGDALRALSRNEMAIAAYKQSILLKGGSADVFHHLGEALTVSGRLEEAIDVFKKLRELEPNAPDAHNNLGLLLEKAGRFDEALAEYDVAIRTGSSPEAHNNLANYFNSQSKLDRSMEEYRKALEIDPTFYEAWSNLANALTEFGELDQALDAYRKALELKPAFAGARSNMLLAMLYNPHLTPDQLIAEHRRWEEVHGAALRDRIRPHTNDRAPDRRLRVGYLSPDFRSHAVAFFSLPVLLAHDPGQFELYCYSNSVQVDGVTKRFQGATRNWHNIVAISDDQAAELIRSHQIDILVDLAGHTANNRLPIFAHKPAPIQITAWGYPFSTGLSSIDFKITDAWCDPPGDSDSLNSEQLIRMPDCFWCYRPPDQSADVGPLPLEKNGHVTFGCFNTLAKITPPVMATWGRIMSRTPGSRLIMKANALASSAGRERVLGIFRSHGVDAARVELSGRGGFREYQELFNKVDLTLDPFPFNGGTTTCHSLWMGVPVVALAGASQQARMGVSILNCIQLPELVASSDDEYVNTTVSLACDSARLNELRRGMRDRLASSPLLDAARFTRHLESAYRKISRDWCNKSA